MGTNIGVAPIDILGFADDLNPIGDSMEVVEQNTNTLVEGAKSISLKVNQDKIEMMELLSNREVNVIINDYIFEKVKELKYLGTTIINND